jgi:hypothetical protein
MKSILRRTAVPSNTGIEKKKDPNSIMHISPLGHCKEKKLNPM